MSRTNVATISESKYLDRALDLLHGYLNTLGLIQRAVEAVTRNIALRRQSIMPRGISKLPHDILSRIMDLSCDQKEMARHSGNLKGTKLMPLELTRVCRQFRAIALDTKIIWATIHSQFQRSTMQLFLERSRPCPLTIVIQPENYDDPELDAYTELGVALAEADRWKVLRICECDSWRYRHASGLVNGMKNLYLPNLTTIVFRGSSINEWNPSGWRVPKLEEISFVEDVAYGLAPLLKPTLKNVTLTLNGGKCNSCLTTVSNLPNLEVLRLHFLDHATFPRTTAGRPPELTLPSLKKLSISMHLYSYSGNAHTSVLLLQLPNLTVLEISFKDKYSSESKSPHHFLASVVTAGSRMPNLRELSLDYAGQFGQEPGMDVSGTLLRGLPNLRAFSLIGPGIVPFGILLPSSEENYWKDLPILEYLAFSEMPDTLINRAYIASLLRSLRSSPRHWESLKNVIVQNCAGFGEGDRRALREELDGRSLRLHDCDHSFLAESGRAPEMRLNYW